MYLDILSLFFYSAIYNPFKPPNMMQIVTKP